MCMTVQPEANGVCHVLLEDPDLAECVPEERREQVARTCMVRELYFDRGSWSGQRPDMPHEIGMLMVDGLMMRRVGVDGRFGAELIGRGDVLSPWHDEHEVRMLPLEHAWTVLQPTRLAVLDERFARLLGRYPNLTTRLMSRALRRSRNLAIAVAIIHHARVDARIQMLLWHLAGRFGRVRGDGVIVPVRLTHAQIAELVAARRPTVTSALSKLASDGRVRSVGGAWLLSGEPPGELAEAGRNGPHIPPGN
jgi:CRP/FNR family transcriptional regulator, cyclic AMP receptor protein